MPLLLKRGFWLHLCLGGVTVPAIYVLALHVVTLRRLTVMLVIQLRLKSLGLITCPLIYVVAVKAIFVYLCHHIF